MFNPNARSMNTAAVLAVLSAAAYADNAHERAVSGKGKALFVHTLAPDPLAAGTIQRLDAKSAQVTIAHGPLPSLGMGTMTTAFLVRDPAMFKSIKTGQSVRFAAERVGGLYTVTHVEAVRR